MRSWCATDGTDAPRKTDERIKMRVIGDPFELCIERQRESAREDSTLLKSKPLRPRSACQYSSPPSKSSHHSIITHETMRITRGVSANPSLSLCCQV